MTQYFNVNNQVHELPDGINPDDYIKQPYIAITLAQADELRTSKIIPLTYQQKRVSLYATIPDQLDMIYHDKLNGTTIWKDHITSIKSAIPKI
jgi:hypothetical protein